jgi:stress response protein YsnF
MTISDQPFAGAQAQVRGAHRDAEPASTDMHRPVRLEATLERSDNRWTARLPVRSELVTPSKETVVYERVIVSTHVLSEVERLEDTVRREELTIEEHPPRE